MGVWGVGVGGWVGGGVTSKYEVHVTYMCSKSSTGVYSVYINMYTAICIKLYMWNGHGKNEQIHNHIYIYICERPKQLCFIPMREWYRLHWAPGT